MGRRAGSSARRSRSLVIGKIVGRRAEGRRSRKLPSCGFPSRSCTGRRPSSARRCQGMGPARPPRRWSGTWSPAGRWSPPGWSTRRRVRSMIDEDRGRRCGLVQGDLAAAHARGVVPAAHRRADGGQRMKQVVQNYRSGELAMLEVPVPGVPSGWSTRSDPGSPSCPPGQSSMKIEESRKSLLGKARARPDQVRQVVQSVSQQGLLPHVPEGLRHASTPTRPSGTACAEGWSRSAADVQRPSRGRRRGLRRQLRTHCTRSSTIVPPGVIEARILRSRRSAPSPCRATDSPRPGSERWPWSSASAWWDSCSCSSSAPRACRVLGVDPSETRCRLAEQTGASRCGPPSGGGLDGLVAHLTEVTGGAGADHVFLTAGGKQGSAGVELAGRAGPRPRTCRGHRQDAPGPARGRSNTRRSSTSGSRARTDPAATTRSYEEMGVDYPIGYVRWTEQRNMRLFPGAARQGLRSTSLRWVDQVVDFGQGVQAVTSVSDVRRARQVWDSSSATGGTPAWARRVMAGRDDRGQRRRPALSSAWASSVPAATPRVHAPAAPPWGASDVRLVEVATSTSLSAAPVGPFGFDRCSTDYHSLLADDTIDAVLIATRHHAHARGWLRMRCGPARRSSSRSRWPSAWRTSTSIIDSHRRDRQRPTHGGLQPPIRTAADLSWGRRTGPITVRYDVNAGAAVAGKLVRAARRGVTCLSGSAGHFIDTASWWIGSEPTEVYAVASSADADDAVITVRYAGVGVLARVPDDRRGPRYPKEVLQVFGGGQVAQDAQLPARSSTGDMVGGRVCSQPTWDQQGSARASWRRS